VIGINAQIRSSGSSSSSGFEGVGFAVPINSARRSMLALASGSPVRYAYVGITTEDLTPAIAKKFGYAARRGALIDSFATGDSAGRRAGLRAGNRDELYEGLAVRVGGDAIVAINGIPVTSAEDVVRIVAERLVPGEVASFTVVDGKQRRVVPVTLTARPR
jgi:2-alkenal reductase